MLQIHDYYYYYYYEVIFLYVFPVAMFSKDIHCLTQVEDETANDDEPTGDLGQFALLNRSI